MKKMLVNKKRLNNEIREMLGFSVGYNFKKVDDVNMALYEEDRRVANGALNFGDYSFYNFNKLYESVEQYVQNNMKPNEELVKVTANMVAKKLNCDEYSAREYIEMIHKNFVNDIWTMLKNAKPYSLTAVKIGKCYFTDRIMETSKRTDFLNDVQFTA